VTEAVRAAAVAGTFYPGEPDALRSQVDAFLEVAVPGDEPLPKALIVPHAGYMYSGLTAGAAYARVKRLRGTVERVVLVGPAHRVSIDAIAVSPADAFLTPLGAVAVDDGLRRRALALSAVRIGDRAHASEHALEVQLPFLQRALGEFSVLPLLVGNVSTDDVAKVLDALWGGDETLIVVTSDLSHYHDYATARSHDARTAAAIVAGAGDWIRDDDACGARPVGGLLKAARHHGLGVRLVDLGNSADTAGGRECVVGYGALAVWASPQR
jgi:AmmeMemoRadiSam system protein B